MKPLEITETETRISRGDVVATPRTAAVPKITQG